MLNANQVVYAYKNRYQTVRAVDGVSQSFEPGRFYAIVGKSGSGKTTLLSLLAGLDLPSGGSVTFDGTSTTDMDLDGYRRDNVAVICQSYNLFPLLTALENVLYPLELKKIPKANARQIAAEKLLSVGIEQSQFKRLPAMLSGGEQQRVAIARALAEAAKVILADEPTGNLDTENGKNIVAILKRLAHEENRCVIVVTHDLAIAEEADEVLRMRDGRIEEAANATAP
ncbi:MAG TPA: ABC transporter ATP-binding protein [Clostridia bacterium]|nr:ABC transporter ATP-binding protein [Clostridia bacterium]